MPEHICHWANMQVDTTMTYDGRHHVRLYVFRAHVTLYWRGLKPWDRW